MRIDVFTLFPETMIPYLESSILGKAQEAGLLHVLLHNIRDYTSDRHHTTDDEPYGGGGGMVMKPEPIFSAVESVLGEGINTIPLILLTPQGRVFDQKKAVDLSRYEHLAFLCGRYEGIDERVREFLVTEEISMGDYVLTGGELPVLVVIDALARQIPGVLGDADAAAKDSHAMGLLEHPHYTRPAEFRGWQVPEVLLSGNHARVETWRRQEALRRTYFRRPDLLEKLSLNATDLIFLQQLREVEKQLSDPRESES
ncbi:MAG: tRNA (guanosine(37)-N1)-methyltransferase TrmD [Anaerolineales bacterium]|nr:tRNA (guanosine(37)-N1)-methyltransferase TrmD [Anaerolineales bacterium]